MKYAGLAVASLSSLLLVLPAGAQKKSHDLPPPPAQNSSATSTSADSTNSTQSSDAAQQTHGQVIFSRSTDADGQTTTHTDPAAAALPASRPAGQPAAEDADRAALTFTAYDMDVRLRPTDQQIAVRALITVRNDSKSLLSRLPLQLSSSLNWERMRVAGRNATFTTATLNSDADHTGQLHEAVIALATPLVPGQSLQLDVTYSGSIHKSAQRLMAIGTPDRVALHSDWDQIAVDFTGLRGFGNVVWYPVASVPTVLGDGARLFDAMGEHKMRLGGAEFRLRLTDEFPHGHPPTIALINGHPVEMTITKVESVGPEVNGVATASLDHSVLGFDAPSLFVAERTAHTATNTVLWTLPESDAAAPSWTNSVTRVTPFLQGWLGQSPRSQLTVLDLPDPEDSPFESGALLATSVRIAEPDQLDGILAHALTHAWMQSPRAWLSEGVAHFMGTLWMEHQRGRQQTLEMLEAGRNALALAEPSSPGTSAGQPLAQAISPIYYRNKAAYVLWMLRDIVTDSTLSAALRAYNPAMDVPAGYGHDNAPSSFQKLLEQAGSRADLNWFFSDWVNNDKGLADLQIDGVYPTMATAGNWIVSVNVLNNGYAAVEVPITVRSDTATVTQRVFIPARGKAVQRLLIQSKPAQVQLNDGIAPETQAALHLVDVSDNINRKQ